MSEYWKSNPRKFCDFCKCWIADNRPSIEFHEKGKRHNENVRIKLAEIGKKGREDYETKLQEDDYMKSMEEAALQAYKKDIEKNPDMMADKINEIALAKNAEIVIGSKKEEIKEDESKVNKKWKEVVTAEGESYYWNMETQETSWEPPEEGYIKKRKKKKKGKNEDDNNESVPIGPILKSEPFSSWETVKKHEDNVDLQLPFIESNDYYCPEVILKKPDLSFKEKTVSLGSTSSSGVAFKKRKCNENFKKNSRMRSAEL